MTRPIVRRPFHSDCNLASDGIDRHDGSSQLPRFQELWDGCKFEIDRHATHYQYVGSDPLGSTDPFGLEEVPKELPPINIALPHPTVPDKVTRYCKNHWNEYVRMHPIAVKCDQDFFRATAKLPPDRRKKCRALIFACGPCPRAIELAQFHPDLGAIVLCTTHPGCVRKAEFVSMAVCCVSVAQVCRSCSLTPRGFHNDDSDVACPMRC